LQRTHSRLRAAVEGATHTENLAAGWVGRVRPLATRLYDLRRRIATVAVGALAVSLTVHVMFGANGMVAYRQKRAEYEALKKQIEKAQEENDHYTEQIEGLKSDEKAIEKEAREQLGYAKPGEYVYVETPPAKTAAPATHPPKK
jgi:cell division protein FtsB